MTNTRQRQQLQVLRLLRDFDFFSHQQIATTLWSAETRPVKTGKAIANAMIDLRNKLRSAGSKIEIRTLLGRGYDLSADDRLRVHNAAKALQELQGKRSGNNKTSWPSWKKSKEQIAMRTRD